MKIVAFVLGNYCLAMESGEWAISKMDREGLRASWEQIRDLKKRVGEIERRHEGSRTRAVTIARQEEEQRSQACDPYAINMLIRALLVGFTDTRFVRCPEDYYDWDLSERRRFLKAPSTKHLTKSIVFENTRFDGDGDGDGDGKGEQEGDERSRLSESRYVCCVVGYGDGVDSDMLRKMGRESGSKDGVLASASKFNFRVANDCLDISGYERNGVTPLGMRTSMPVVLDEKVDKLEPPIFWLGGGQVSLKWMVKVEEFRAVFNPLVARISTSM